MVGEDLVSLTIETLSHQGVTLTNMDTESSPPKYFVEINHSKMIASLEDTLKSAYGILWVLTYGKLSDKNRNEKIDLQYREVGGIKNDSN